MKKAVLYVIAVAGITLSSYGQEKGKNSLEITLNPAALFDGSAGPLFEMPYLKARFFVQENIAFRVGLGASIDAQTNHPFNSPENIEKNSAFLFSFSPGAEKHFGDGRFSPYVGAGLNLTWRTSRGKYNVGSTNITTRSVWTDGSHPGYFGLGLSGYLGCDYSVTDNFYLGFELAPRFSYQRNLEQERNTSGTSVTTPPSSLVSFSLYSSSGLRAGIRF